MYAAIKAFSNDVESRHEHRTESCVFSLKPLPQTQTWDIDCGLLVLYKVVWPTSNRVLRGWEIVLYDASGQLWEKYVNEEELARMYYKFCDSIDITQTLWRKLPHDEEYAIVRNLATYGKSLEIELRSVIQEKGRVELAKA
jgi:hypothetical protein